MRGALYMRARSREEESSSGSNISIGVIVILSYLVILLIYGFAHEAIDTLTGGIPLISNMTDYDSLIDAFSTSPLFFAREYFRLFLMIFVTLVISVAIPRGNNGIIRQILFKTVVGVITNFLAIVIVNRVLLSQEMIAVLFDWISGLFLFTTASLTILSSIKFKAASTGVFFIALFSLFRSKTFKLIKAAFLYSTLIVIIVSYLDARFGDIHTLINNALPFT